MFLMEVTIGKISKTCYSSQNKKYMNSLIQLFHFTQSTYRSILTCAQTYNCKNSYYSQTGRSENL